MKIFVIILILTLISNLFAKNKEVNISCSRGLGICCSSLEPKYCKCSKSRNNCPYYFPSCPDKKQKRVVRNDDISLEIMCE